MKFSNVEFVVNSSSDSPTFKTHDTIDGEIAFTPHQETNIRDITITFKGMMRVEVENMNTHLALPSNSLQKPFLSIDMPIYNYFGDTSTLKPGKSYRLPFKFIIPEELPIQACCHQCANHQIQHEHLQLPATLSYRATKSHKIHDMSPEMAEVVYGINFALWRPDGKAGRSKIQEAIHPVQILPTRNEHPPILVPRKNKYYRLEAEKSLSTGILRHSRGKLVACSAQPPAIQLQSLQPTNTDASTTLKIDLRFDAANLDQSPPRVLAAEFHLRAMTFFGLEPWQDYPDLTDVSTWGSRRDFWSDYVTLMPTDEIEFEWKSQEEEDRAIFTASIETCVSLPTHRRYPPTFHSCLVSRVYALKATLFYRVHGNALGRSSTFVSVPVEICAL
ncbi:unnamed protein product [Penicillium nalgiovense]|uniref:Arrestin-like N-terminal domain-containing protein n=1 Tax=Penicillium nalgiovense TaxID=60175 RepID=A0A1V6Y7Q1_PENNA|nr:hypothetical protein PENNAL_c0032G07609 [Penicillium nalgiovense]CAG7939746.1 unnamed protein product [Penicillium nalgiovense]CAG7942014.1 unnamed protein product [Penicillium nalgiovense]CAG7944197.1 unnamed protein product [Penicillium nalgiovense]CAG7945597.1 unnamed protein product [Penicillium nalgiovense]